MDSWHEMKPYIDETVKQVKKIPAPPVPDDSWGQKMNDLNRAVHGLREHCDSRIQAEQAMED
jgi:hypothetical protein